MKRVGGVAKHYAWGHPSALADLLGRPADGQPLAELWFGTHPSGPSTVVDTPAADESPELLEDIAGQAPELPEDIAGQAPELPEDIAGQAPELPEDIAGQAPELPEDIAGQAPELLEDIAGRLPYLLKLLAAAEPLSLQAHPTAAQARAGFDREEAAGVTGPERIFVDPDPKPEIVVALTPFDALCGFRPPDATIALLRSIGGDAEPLADRLLTDGLEGLVTHLMVDQPALDGLVDACAEHDSAEARCIVDIARRHPSDPAVGVALLLNHVVLRPGQALYLAAGNLHAYLRGTAVEVMGASDNVVRGGLTSKHVDVVELLRMLDYSPLAEPLCRPERISPTTVRFPTPEAPFVLYGHHVDGVLDLEASTRELLLCAAGSTTEVATGEVAYLGPGDRLHLHGTATLFHVTEPPPAG